MDSEEADLLHSVCQGVFEAVAECVEILYFDVCTNDLEDFPATLFPRLAELASYGFSVVPAYPPDIAGPNTTPCSPCPELRHWHLLELLEIVRCQGGVTTGGVGYLPITYPVAILPHNKNLRKAM
ncbi:hypothetical protein FIBSPDRAFT_891264 [Athelia psychrophila]|uniref:Uncharacterized protein n=1 Tax=Athelia psychrophila TaxID=1759441 RepID=A0A166JYM2_9AGAM|nr:hypothetical protein FIBSPDRAFT_891264 [Fibularhizoctonia sp. CBS 109695]